MLRKATRRARHSGSRSRCSLECGVRGYRRSPRRSGPSRPSGRGRLRRPRPLRLEGPTLHAGRYALCGYGCIERGGLCSGRSAKPRGAAPACRVELRPTRQRATSHNGARYASVHPKPRPAKTRSASWGSHVALSGAPPRCLQAEKSGSDCRHTFRPSGNPTGWNRKRSVPLALLSARSKVVGCANGAAKRSAARKSGLPLVGLRREAPRFAPGFPLPSASSFRCPVRSTPGPAILSFKRTSFTLAPVAVTENAETFSAPAPTLAAGITPAKPSCCLLVAR